MVMQKLVQAHARDQVFSIVRILKEGRWMTLSWIWQARAQIVESRVWIVIKEQGEAVLILKFVMFARAQVSSLIFRVFF